MAASRVQTLPPQLPASWLSVDMKKVFFSKRSILTLQFSNSHIKQDVSFLQHIFQKAQVTLNKNAHNLQHHFGAQFFMLFHMVWFILFGVLGRETTFSLVEVFQQPIRNFHLKVFSANKRNKMDHIRWKTKKNCAPKWCCKLCAFLFKVACAFWKMCTG